MAKKTPQIFSSKVFVSPPMKAVFNPKLNKPDEEYDNYEVNVDVLNNPEFLETLRAQANECLTGAQEKLETKKKPTNDFVRVVETKQGEKLQLATFRMKATRTVRGQEIKQKPRVVDAHRLPYIGPVGSGSTIKVAYYFQYTLMPNGIAYLSLKLDSVQVINLVLNGAPAIDQLFGVEEEGFSAETPEEEEDTEETDEDDGGDDDQPKAANGRDF